MRQAQLRQNEVFRALADPTRRALLDLLRDDDANVGALVESFDMTQSAVSQHLKVLRNAGLVHERKSGRERIYSLNAEPLAIAYDWFAHYTEFWETRLLNLGKHLRKRHAKKNPV
ncbi:MAG: metalloregulator ArsR/SmtB family transcription factor [Rhizomicrobium sp.]|jgi:DNA-binding transcriptional ArsR family regulator